MGRNPAIDLEDSEVSGMFADPQWEQKFPPILLLEQAAELASVSTQTIYDWSSRGLLANCATKRGKRLRILRDRFVKFLFSDES